MARTVSKICGDWTIATEGSAVYGMRWRRKSGRGQKSASKTTTNSARERVRPWLRFPAFLPTPGSSRWL